MNPSQLKAVFLVLGGTALAFGLYTAWDQYQIVSAVGAAASEMVDMFGAFVEDGGQYAEQMKASMRVSYLSLVLKQAWVWVGAVLVALPFAVGLGRR